MASEGVVAGGNAYPWHFYLGSEMHLPLGPTYKQG